MRRNTRRYISSTSSRRVGRVSRIIFSPAIFTNEVAETEQPSVIESTISETPVINEAPKVEDTVVEETKEPVVEIFDTEDEQETVSTPYIPVDTESEDDAEKQEEPKVEEPERKESAYAKRKKAKQENNK